MNVVGGLVMTKSPQWKPSFRLIEEKLKLIENEISKEIQLTFVPITRWKGYKGNRDIAGDAIETISLASYLLAKTERINVFSTITTFAYEPEMVAHAALRLNYEFDNRFALNIVGGWKKDEFEYFHKQFLGDSNEVYEFASKWVMRFRKAEREYHEVLKEIFEKSQINIRTEIISAAFSKPGREFANKYADSLFTTLKEKQIVKKKFKCKFFYCLNNFCKK